MSSKAPKPTLTGQRIRSRKRDEKTKYDPPGFRDEVTEVLNQCVVGAEPPAAAADPDAAVAAEGAGAAVTPPPVAVAPPGAWDLDKAYKLLDKKGGELEYRRYADTLFDTLFAGGILAPGGSIITDSPLCEICIFACPLEGNSVDRVINLIDKVIRRYKYLQVHLEDFVVKILKFTKAFTADQQTKLAFGVSYCVQRGLVTAKPLSQLFAESLVKDGTSLAFFTAFCQCWLKESSASALGIVLRKAGLESQLLQFFPDGKRTGELFRQHCETTPGLKDLISFQAGLQSQGARKVMMADIIAMLQSDPVPPIKDVVAFVKDGAAKNQLDDTDVGTLLWGVLMNVPEWNKKVDLAQEQALKHIRQYAPLLQAFTAENPKAQLRLLVRMQEFCYDNQTFMRVFDKLALLLYKADVLGEEAILGWYDNAHSPKGKTAFLESMTKMVDWLRNAEEESSEEEED